jgi:plastocyanin
MATVDINSFKYKPVVIAVRKGGRVRWTNSDAAAHTATADDRSFDTQTIDRGKARVVSFTTAGTFAYHCDFHPFMKATVVVR